jgi:hypothetical protein
MGWKSHGPRSADAKHFGQFSANLPPAATACILSSPESALFLSARSPGLSRSYALNNYIPTRAKWRSSPSASCSVLEKCLTVSALSERRYYVN